MSKDTISSLTSYLVNGTAAVSGLLSFNQWMAFGGLVLGFMTYLSNNHYQKQRNEILKSRIAKEAIDSDKPG